jgi:hypothetical protein
MLKQQLGHITVADVLDEKLTPSPQAASARIMPVTW